MFDLLFFNLRAQGVRVGLSEWLAFLDGVRQGLVEDIDGLYAFGRALLVTSETQYDAWDVAFQATFAGVELPPELSAMLQQWLAEALDPRDELPPELDLSPEELRELFLQRLREQKERHDGGNKWIGTAGSSPFGHSGRASQGIRAGGGGGGRSAIQVAGERRWASYRVDKQLDHRDFQVALRALRNLAREGRWQLDVDGTIDATAKAGGDIDIVEERERANRVHLVLIMDTGGSMSPYAQLCNQLFTAASEMKGFKSFQSWYFHNAPYGHLYRDYATWDRASIDEVLHGLTPQHRVVWVGDASMAPWELFTQFNGGPWMSTERGGRSGLDWLRIFKERCPSSIWLNPDPPGYWEHPTVRAIRSVFPMYPLTLQGLRDGVKKLRSPRTAA